MPQLKSGDSCEIPSIDLVQLGLMESLSVPLWIYDLDDFGIRWANPEGVAFWGADSLEDLCRRPVVPDTEGVKTRMALLRLALEKGERVAEQWTLFPGGRPVPVLCICRGVQLVDGHFAMLIEGSTTPGETQLVSELRAVEAIRHTQLMISMFTPEGRTLMHNPAAAGLINRLGIVEEHLGDTYRSLFVDGARADRLRRAALERGEGEAILDVVARPTRTHHVSIRVARDPLSGAPALLVAQQDVTRAQRLEAQLKRALERERATTETQRRFISIASHEFKTPLSIIDGAAQRILRSDAAADERLAERAKGIRAAVMRMSHAVDNTLAATRIEEGRVACMREPVDLHEIVARVCAAQQILAPNRMIRVELGPLPPLDLDPILTEQVLENILSNALKYSPEDQAVEIGVRINARHVMLTVADRGIGIPKEEMRQLFTRFFRASNARGTAGTGIGLSTVRYFMQLQDGQVRLRPRPGGGTIAELRFRR